MYNPAASIRKSVRRAFQKHFRECPFKLTVIPYRFENAPWPGNLRVLWEDGPSVEELLSAFCVEERKPGNIPDTWKKWDLGPYLWYKGWRFETVRTLSREGQQEVLRRVSLPGKNTPL